LPAVEAPSIAPDVVTPLREPASAFSNAFAIVAAVALAGVAAFFSVEVFPGAPVAASMEAGKLIIAGWLAANWSVARWKLRMVLVTGLALINAVGVFGKLVEEHGIRKRPSNIVVAGYAPGEE